MAFEWDEAKAASNRAKHGVSFDLARRGWDDPLHAIIPDRIENGEQRWHAIGIVGSILLLVAHLYPDPDDESRTRFIGARRATARERRNYEQEDL